jgi:hypothetical protein
MDSRPAEVRLNQPIRVGEFRISQQAWDMDDPHRPQFTVLGVTNRPAVPLIWAGCVLILLGMPYAFYVKPLPRRRRTKGGAA